MEKKQAMKWVKALRSGKFKQGKNALKKTEEGKTSYCCLGVLAEISGAVGYGAASNGLLEDRQVRDKCGIATSDGTPLDEHGRGIPVSSLDAFRINTGYRRFSNLAGANDMCVSFKAIATWIEKNYKLL